MRKLKFPFDKHFYFDSFEDNDYLLEEDFDLDEETADSAKGTDDEAEGY